MAIFPCEHWLAGFIVAKDDKSGGDDWIYRTCRSDALAVIKPTVSSTAINHSCIVGIAVANSFLY